MNLTPVGYAVYVAFFYVTLFVAGFIATRWLIERIRRAFRRTWRRAPKPATPWNDESDPTIGWVYVIWLTGESRPLYVGSAKRWPGSRLTDHASKDWWRPLYTHGGVIVIMKFQSYAACHEAEKWWIQNRNPIVNKVRYSASRVQERTPVLTLELPLIVRHRVPNADEWLFAGDVNGPRDVRS